MEEYIENERFNAAKEKIIGKKHNDKGIGTLSEKTVHGVLKHFFEPDEDCHEVALNGYFADIYNDSGVIEIQTRQFNKLREKLAVFLNYYPVTVVQRAAQLFAQRRDVHAGRVAKAVDAAVPYMLDKLFLAHRPPLVKHQVFQDAGLLAREG